MEWINAGKHVLGPGNATYSFVKTDQNGKVVEEMLIGQTRYGKGHEPPEGHRPITIVDVESRGQTETTDRLKSADG